MESATKAKVKCSFTFEEFWHPDPRLQSGCQRGRRPRVNAHEFCALGDLNLQKIDSLCHKMTSLLLHRLSFSSVLFPSISFSFFLFPFLPLSLPSFLLSMLCLNPELKSIYCICLVDRPVSSNLMLCYLIIAAISHMSLFK